MQHAPSVVEHPSVSGCVVIGEIYPMYKPLGIIILRYTMNLHVGSGRKLICKAIPISWSRHIQCFGSANAR